jgi:hypothetical protein
MRLQWHQCVCNSINASATASMHLNGIDASAMALMHLQWYRCVCNGIIAFATGSMPL